VQHLARQAGGGEPGGDYGNGFHERTSFQFLALTGKCEICDGIALPAV
jgi:hypothetical protein